MMTFFSGVWMKIAAVLAVIGAVVLVIWRIFAAGKASERGAQAERVVKTVAKAKRVEDEVRAQPDVELDEQLRRQRERLK